MQFHGIGREEHPQVHQLTTCMHDHSHSKTVGGAAKAASASAQASQEAQPQGQFSLSAWLEKNLSRGKGLLRSIWGSSQESQAGEPGDRSGIPQVMAQIGDSRETDGRGRNSPGAESLPPDAARTLQASQLSQAAAAVQPGSGMAPDAPAAQAAGGQEEGLWRKVKVRFQDMAGQLTGRRGEARAQTRSSFQMNRERQKEARPRARKPDRDALEIDSYRVEESYLLDSYDRKGGYSKISTKK